MTGNAETIRDRVDVQQHPTVVRLSDLEKGNSEWLTRSFVKTPDIENHLQSLQRVFQSSQGSGVFLIGHYGSGKSHFLAYVIQALRNTGWIDASPAVSFASLLNFSAGNRLEDVVAGCLGVDCGDGDRRLAWEKWHRQYEGEGCVLVLDEVSEFLRSKPGVREFTEDIRFLQFLGEWAGDRRFWVLAAMQEAVEHTGELEYSLYRKIKDRYPLRLILSPAHVQTLIADGILNKKAGYDRGVGELVDKLQRCFPGAGSNLPMLARIYPLHPATLELLEEVRDRFSEARGIVDFTIARLAGDPARGIPAFLDRAWGELLTPDLIIDHFHDLFELQPEFLPLAQQVLPWYRRQMPELFASDPLRVLAQRILKLLILVHLSPGRETLSVAEASEWLLFSAIVSDPAKNTAVVAKVLARLCARGRFILEENGQYRLVPDIDGSEHLQRMIEREAASLKGQTALVIDLLVPLLPQSSFNPFLLPRNCWQNRTVRWHFHERGYSVWFGEKVPQECEGPGFWLRLPWADSAMAGPVASIRPGAFVITDELITLAALGKLADQPIAAEHRKQIGQRINDGLPGAVNAIRMLWSEATLVSADGREEAGPVVKSATTLVQWLDSIALRQLARRYPGFERFAPVHGPLSRDIWLRFLRGILAGPDSESVSNECVKLVHEAYLVPMGLCRRSRTGYVVTRNLGNQELVRAVLPLLEHSPSPTEVHSHLAAPVYGLVTDQVNLLLVFLMLQGEIDIVKGAHSYRDYFETLVNPLQYDRIEPGHALNSEMVLSLQSLCRALSIRTSASWNVLAQKRALQSLAEHARRILPGLESLETSLGSGDSSAELRRRLKAQTTVWEALATVSAPLEFEGLHPQLLPVDDFIRESTEFQRLVERLPVLVEEMHRRCFQFQQLLQVGTADESIVDAVRGHAAAPAPSDLTALENWLQSSRGVYATYKQAYSSAHDRWWREQPAADAWRWRPPAVAFSKHLGLAAELENLETLRKQCAREQCNGLVNLEYQPVCGCGFDGKSAPFAESLEKFEQVRATITRRLEEFFQQSAVREDLADWSERDTVTGTDVTAYLSGKSPLPEVRDIGLFDRSFCSGERVGTLDFSEFGRRVGDRVWDKARLEQEFGSWLGARGERRLRFKGTAGTEKPEDGLLGWCLEQSLRHAVRLPDALPQSAGKDIPRFFRAEWVSEQSVEQLAGLNLGEAVEDRVLGEILNNRIPLPRGPVSPESPLFSVAQIIRPEHPQSPLQLAAYSQALYGFHPRMMKLEPTRWLQRLQTLAMSSPGNLPQLPQILEQHVSAQWLLLDCWGLSLLQPVCTAIRTVLHDWNFGEVEFCEVPVPTSTDHCYRQLLDAGVNHAFQKIDVIDRAIHNRSVSHPNLIRLVVTELEIELTAMKSRLDPRDLLVFSDHGFRLAGNGRGYHHGQGSTLERVVPVWRGAHR